MLYESKYEFNKWGNEMKFETGRSISVNLPADGEVFEKITSWVFNKSWMMNNKMILKMWKCNARRETIKFL